jgi:hypothetical protein
MLKTIGADIILMDLQYAPMVLASSDHAIVEAMIAEAAINRPLREHLFRTTIYDLRTMDDPKALLARYGLHCAA